MTSFEGRRTRWAEAALRALVATSVVALVLVATAANQVAYGTQDPPPTSAGGDGPPRDLLEPSTPQVHRPSGGSTVRVYGEGFLGTTSVTIGGVGTRFRVVDSDLIIATVPRAGVPLVANDAFAHITVTEDGSTATTDLDGDGEVDTADCTTGCEALGPELGAIFYTDASLTARPGGAAPGGATASMTLTGHRLNQNGWPFTELNPLVNFLEDGPADPDVIPPGPGYGVPVTFVSTDAAGNAAADMTILAHPTFNVKDYGDFDSNAVCPVTQETADHGLDRCILGYSEFGMASLETSFSFASYAFDPPRVDPVPAPPQLQVLACTAGGACTDPAGGVVEGETVRVAGRTWNAAPHFGSGTTPADDPGQSALLIDLCTDDLSACTPAGAPDAAVSVTRYFDGDGNPNEPDAQPVTGAFSGTDLSGTFTVPKTGRCTPRCVVRVRQQRYDIERNAPVDGAFISATAVLPIRNRAPIAIADQFLADQDQVLAVAAANGVRANDRDPDDGDAIVAAALAEDAASGSVTVAADGSFSYTPDPGFSGIDTFTYTVDDGQATATGTAIVHVNQAGNTRPTAGADRYTTDEDVTLTIPAPGVLANDVDPDRSAEGASDVLVAGWVEPPAKGSLALAPDGSFVYEPSPDTFGQDRFTYSTSDGRGGAALRTTVTIEVGAVNDPPEAVDDDYLAVSGKARTVEAPGVLENDIDPEEATLVAGGASDPPGGTVDLRPDGSFTYTADAGFTGTDTFTYTVGDGPPGDPATASDTATVTLRVTVEADIQVTMTDTADPVEPGGEQTYAIIVKNTGPGTATSAGVRITLPNGSGFVSASATQGSCRAPLKTGRFLVCQLGTLVKDGSAEVTVVLTAPTAPGVMVLRATGFGAEADTNPTNSTRSEESEIARGKVPPNTGNNFFDFGPRSGPPGTRVQFRGPGIVGVTGLRFGDAMGRDLRVEGPDVVSVAVPDGLAGAVDITVIGSRNDGYVEPRGFFVITDAFSYSVEPRTGVRPGDVLNVSIRGYVPFGGAVLVLVSPLVGHVEPPPGNTLLTAPAGPPPQVRPLEFITLDENGDYTGVARLPTTERIGGPGGYDQQAVCPVSKEQANAGLTGCKLALTLFGEAIIEMPLGYAGDPAPDGPTLRTSAPTVAAGRSMPIDGSSWHAAPLGGSSTTKKTMSVDLCGIGNVPAACVSGGTAEIPRTKYQYAFDPLDNRGGTLVGGRLAGSVQVPAGTAPCDCTVRVRQQVLVGDKASGEVLEATARLTVVEGEGPLFLPGDGLTVPTDPETAGNGTPPPPPPPRPSPPRRRPRRRPPPATRWSATSMTTRPSPSS